MSLASVCIPVADSGTLVMPKGLLVAALVGVSTVPCLRRPPGSAWWLNWPTAISAISVSMVNRKNFLPLDTPTLPLPRTCPRRARVQAPEANVRKRRERRVSPRSRNDYGRPTLAFVNLINPTEEFCHA